MKLHKLSILAILSLIFIGCGGGNSTSSSSSPTIVEENSTTTTTEIESFYPPYQEIDENFTIINSGYINVNYDSNKKFKVIRTQEEFNKTYKTFDSTNIPEIDFDNGRVLAFIGGDRDTSLYSTKVKEVTRVIDKTEYTIVSLETTIVKDECIEDRELVLPFNFIYTTLRGSIIFDENLKVESCVESELNETPTLISFREIDLMNGSSYIGEIEEKMLEVVQDSQTFRNLYYNHINPITFDKESPSINFFEETLLAIFMGPRVAYKSAIEVTSIKEYENYIEVEIKNTLVKAGAVLPAKTSPVTFVVIPKTDKEIIFKEYVNII